MIWTLLTYTRISTLRQYASNSLNDVFKASYLSVLHRGLSRPSFLSKLGTFSPFEITTPSVFLPSLALFRISFRIYFRSVSLRFFWTPHALRCFSYWLLLSGQDELAGGTYTRIGIKKKIKYLALNPYDCSIMVTTTSSLLFAKCSEIVSLREFQRSSGFPLRGIVKAPSPQKDFASRECLWKKSIELK